jgi:hypothetical protein
MRKRWRQRCHRAYWFQGGIGGYRVRLTAEHNAELQLFVDRTVDVPSMFIGGKSDWGVYNTRRIRGHAEASVHSNGEPSLVEGVGHRRNKKRQRPYPNDRPGLIHIRACLPIRPWTGLTIGTIGNHIWHHWT